MTWTKSRIVGFAIGLGVGLAWIIYSFVTLGVDASLSRLAIVVAAIAVIASLISLQLARDTIRPFLFFTGDINTGVQDGKRYVAFRISNTGVLPGSKVRTGVAAFGIDEKVTKDNTSKRYRFPSEDDETTIFPNQTYQSVASLDFNQCEDKNVWEDIVAGKVKLRLNISYCSLGRKHETTQTIRIDEFDANNRKLWGLIVEPQSWK